MSELFKAIGHWFIGSTGQNPLPHRHRWSLTKFTQLRCRDELNLRQKWQLNFITSANKMYLKRSFNHHYISLYLCGSAKPWLKKF